MLKNLVTVLALATPAIASAETRVYDIRATWVVEPSNIFFSCDATERMMKDQHILKIADDGSVTINGLPWKALTEDPDLILAFHNAHWQKTFLTMDIYVNQRGLSGIYYLYGVIPDVNDPRIQYRCRDAVHIEGTRR